MLFALMFSIGCKIPKQLSSTADRIASDTAVNAVLKDSVNTGNMPWQNFFTDSILHQLINAALQNNFDLLQANQDVKIVDIIYFVNSALKQPTLSASLNGQADRYGFYTMNGIGNFDMNLSPNVTPKMQIPELVPDVFIGVRSIWEIDIWGRLNNIRTSSRETLLANIEERKWLITQLVAEVSYLYYDYMALQYEQEVLARNIILQQRALEIVRTLKAGGRATELAVQQFQAQVYRTSALHYELNRQMIETESRINYLCGRFPESINKGTPIMQQLLPDVLQTGIPSTLLSQRPDLSAALHRLLAAYAQTEAARKAFLPSFTISSYLGLQGFRLPELFNAESLTAGLGANLFGPLLQRRQIRGQYAITNAEHDKAWLEYRKRIRYAAMEVHVALKGIENLKEQFSLKQNELSILRSAVETSNELYTNGYANYLEVITAQQSLLEADIDLVQLKKQQMQSIIQLYRSTGGGWE